MNTIDKIKDRIKELKKEPCTKSIVDELEWVISILQPTQEVVEYKTKYCTICWKELSLLERWYVVCDNCFCELD